MNLNDKESLREPLRGNNVILLQKRSSRNENGDLLFLKPCTLFPPLFHFNFFYHECRKLKVGMAYCDSRSFCCTYIRLLVLHHPEKMQNRRYLLLGAWTFMVSLATGSEDKDSN